MKKLFGALIFMLIGVIFIPIVANSVDTYDIIETSQSFTAVENSATVESFVVTQTADSVESVTVNGVTLILTTDYTVVGSTVSLVASASDIGDAVVVNYTYTADMGAVGGFVDLLLIIFVIGVVAGGVAYIKFSN